MLSGPRRSRTGASKSISTPAATGASEILRSPGWPERPSSHYLIRRWLEDARTRPVEFGGPTVEQAMARLWQRVVGGYRPRVAQ
jgi:hypothetical protein